jgi:hypothetical protein
MSLSTKVLIGLAAGIAAGLFLGELAAPLSSVGRAFILALQVTVLPFMMVALVSGLGRLDWKSAVAIARSGGAVLLVLWTIVMAVVLAFPAAFPGWESASFFSRSLVETPAPVDFLDLYIPSNPFASMAGTVVPAIVVFSVALGVALIGMPISSPRDFFKAEPGAIDALVTAAEPGSAWTLVYPRFSVAVPLPDRIAVPVGYAMPYGEPRLHDVVDAFIGLKMSDGTVTTLFQHWYEGHVPARRSRRWSIVHDVLGWAH